ncbi:LysE family translocator [Planktotalea sp.]|uniref:LysE family translocator n=1 Tax=Planktotalea sp. TaxID=2029877 RepID=UPI0035C7E13B
MAFETYLIYLAAVAVFFATPPDTSQLLIISNSVRYGLRKSVYTIAGDLSANCLQKTGAAFGLAAVIATSATAFSVIKWCGVLYLVWIGVQLIRSSDDVSDVAANQSGQALRLYRQGFVTSMANPFAVVFFGALFPQFINPASAILPQLLILGVTYLVVDGAILALWG